MQICDLTTKLINSSFRFHHLGLAVRDLREAAQLYADLFGYEVISGPFNDPIQRVSVSFASRGHGDMTIEFVAPNGSDSPVVRILNQGGSAYHVCYEVPDLSTAMAHLKKFRCAVLSEPVPAVAFEGRMIAWLSTPTRQLIELAEAPGS